MFTDPYKAAHWQIWKNRKSMNFKRICQLWGMEVAAQIILMQARFCDYRPTGTGQLHLLTSVPNRFNTMFVCVLSYKKTLPTFFLGFFRKGFFQGFVHASAQRFFKVFSASWAAAQLPGGAARWAEGGLWEGLWYGIALFWVNVFFRFFCQRAGQKCFFAFAQHFIRFY